ncbi:molybdenum cofactor guanylyltransferase [Microbulbifer bruguierae]|uniref:Molybdenum cofactor guanylyltransferase n=1 Tax=Microbulbifer bruguierae TaxID=3029061 RepID=A0ABY8NC33_9GAMM|nr:molybdenum cofactor guanylyltransferase [Microbulbifer bruguierae]WGL16255.1 molybdenum cofactor guanylyltransferase [Microbulbifer bruguierae]
MESTSARNNEAGRRQRGVKRACPVVLAGGLSSRMGKDKALLKLSSGDTLLDRAKSLFHGLRPPEGLALMPVLVSGSRPGGIPDRTSAAGPLGGLYSIAEHLHQWQLECDALLVVPVDMPMLTPGLLRQLCVAGQTVEQAVCFGNQYLPCWLPLGDRCRNYLRAAASGDAIASMRALFGYLGCVQLPEPEGDWHLNVNRPEDYLRLS